MTIEKSEKVTIPVWLLSVIVSLLITGFTTWGIVSAKSATLEEKAQRNRDDIVDLKSQKVDRSEFLYIKEKLDDIDKKLGKHIDATK